MNETGLLDLAGSLASKAGLAPPTTLQPLAGGKNNRVMRVSLSDGGNAVLKLYHFDPRDTRDRLGAEWGFLEYVWERGVRQVPEPLACDREAHAGLYGFAPGRRLGEDEVDAGAVARATDFVAAINGVPRRPEALAPGSEACFSLAEHLATVERRVARLAMLDETAPYAKDAAALVSGRLKPLWDTVSQRIAAQAAEAGIAVDAAIARPCVSPSDFGYHNALFAQDGAATFIDFEYAGRDDPAKLVCDFFSQPEVPVSLEHFEPFVVAITGPLGLEAEDLWRCRALLPAYRLKWVCIILNEFLPVGASRRAFADAGDREARARRQIARAKRHLDLVAA
jgi:hypothetical protein